MSDEVLKPCPICGKKVSIARTDNEIGERWWFITRGTYRTTRCNCRLFLESEKFTCGWNDDYSLGCRAKLVDKWNTRAELGNGMLTAEQVMAIAGRNQPDYCSDTHVCFDWQAIADELNAVIGGGECEIKQHRCTSCDREINDDAYYVRVNLGNGAWTAESRHANFCPNCGARIRKQVGE